MPVADLVQGAATLLVAALGLAIVASDLRVAIGRRSWLAIALLTATAVGYATAAWYAIRLIPGESRTASR